MKDYQSYRWFYTSKGNLVVGGKNAEQNDELLKKITGSKKDYWVMHTATPGSPFSILIAEPSKVQEKELEECAIFTACFSQEWKRKKKLAEIHLFSTQQLSKPADFKQGSWTVKGRVRTYKVPLMLALTVQKKILRAVPQSAASEVLTLICPGSLDKQEIATTLQFTIGDHFSSEAILRALPAGGSRICMK